MKSNPDKNRNKDDTDIDGTKKPIQTPNPQPTNPGYDDNVGDKDKRSPSQENPGQR